MKYFIFISCLLTAFSAFSSNTCIEVPLPEGLVSYSTSCNFDGSISIIGPRVNIGGDWLYMGVDSGPGICKIIEKMFIHSALKSAYLKGAERHVVDINSEGQIAGYSPASGYKDCIGGVSPFSCGSSYDFIAEIVCR